MLCVATRRRVSGRENGDGQAEPLEDLLDQPALLPTRLGGSAEPDQDVIGMEFLDRVGEGEKILERFGLPVTVFAT